MYYIILARTLGCIILLVKLLVYKMAYFRNSYAADITQQYLNLAIMTYQ